MPLLAALTMASTFMVVISFRTICRGMAAPPRVLVLSYHRWACLAIRRSGEGGLLAPAFPFKQLSRHSNHSCHSCDKKQPPRLSRASNGLFFVYAAHFLRPLCDGLSLSPDGTSFNIQNPIPHPSQKEKGLLETRRAQECQRGIAGAAERAKEGGRVPFESSDTRLGARCREFESPHSDQLG